MLLLLLFLAAHHYCFSYHAYVDMAAEQPNCCSSFLQMWDISDVRKDFQEHMGVMSMYNLILICYMQKSYNNFYKLSFIMIVAGKNLEKLKIYKIPFIWLVSGNTVRSAMPSKVYRHPGGRSTERAHLLSVSDGAGYQSGVNGSEGSNSTSTGQKQPLQAAKSASLSLVAGMEPSESAPGGNSSLPNQTVVDISTFTDIEKYGSEDMNH